jgi:hypothetical protein
MYVGPVSGFTLQIAAYCAPSRWASTSAQVAFVVAGLALVIDL